jgi:hypothetical protein
MLNAAVAAEYGSATHAATVELQGLGQRKMRGLEVSQYEPLYSK